MRTILTGTYNHSIDGKNRIRIPSKLKEDMFENVGIDCSKDSDGEDNKKYSLVFQKGTDNCISIYTQEAINNIFAPLRDIKQSDSRFWSLRKYLTAFKTIESDPQGRFVLPSEFKEHAGITKDIVFCGNVDHVEIWSAEEYNKNFDNGKLDINALVKELGI